MSRCEGSSSTIRIRLRSASLTALRASLCGWGPRCLILGSTIISHKAGRGARTKKRSGLRGQRYYHLAQRKNESRSPFDSDRLRDPRSGQPLGSARDANSRGSVAEFEVVEAAPFVDGDGDDPTEGEEADDEEAGGSETGVKGGEGAEEAAGGV